MSRSHWVLVVLASLIAAASLTRWGKVTPLDGNHVDTKREPRIYRGTVTEGEKPVAGAKVVLREAVLDGAEFEAETDAAGAFTVEWRPTATHLRQRLTLLVWRPGGEAPAAVLRARSRDNTIQLRSAVGWKGSTTGASKDGVVYAGVRRSGRLQKGSGVLPETADAVVLGMAPGCAPRWQTMRAYEHDTHFRMRLARGVDVNIRVKNPEGRPVPNVVVRRAGTPDLASVLPRFRTGEDGVATLEHQSDGDRITVRVEADGYQPVYVGAWPGLDNEVILWPGREVEIKVWDAWNQRGVDNAAFAMQIDAKVAPGRWFGARLGATERPVPVRPGVNIGQFHVLLPRTALELSAGATGYGSSDAKVGEDIKTLEMRLTPPRRRHRTAYLVVRAPDHEGELPLVVTSDTGNWGRPARLVNGHAKIAVRSNVKLKIASTCAAAGVWLPQTPIEPLGGNKEREVVVGLRPAVKLTIRTEPPASGMVALTDLAYRETNNTAREPLVDGVASFLVRPQREFRVTLAVRGNLHSTTAELVSDQEDHEHTITLAHAAGFEATVVDSAGAPVSFARVRVWEATESGRLELRGKPRTLYANADGVVRALGLREGDTAIEIDGPYATAWRSGVFRLRRRRIEKIPTVRLEEPTRWVGRFVAEGKPQAGLKLVALRPEIFRLKFAGGGERQLFNLTAVNLATACSNRDGRFRVDDPWVPATGGAAAKRGRDSLLVVLSDGRSDLAPTVVTRGELESGNGETAIPAGGRVQIFLNGRVRGVYLLLPGGRNAVLLRGDPPMSIRPLPVHLPAGRHTLYVRMNDGREFTKSVVCRADDMVDWRID